MHYVEQLERQGDTRKRCGCSGIQLELEPLVYSYGVPVARTGASFRPFDVHTDYLKYVDGRPRYEGVRSFLNVRVSGDIQTKAVTVPADYLASLPDDTPVKIEVGAIGVGDNATFTEVGDLCVNENEGCE